MEREVREKKIFIEYAHRAFMIAPVMRLSLQIFLRTLSFLKVSSFSSQIMHAKKQVGQVDIRFRMKETYKTNETIIRKIIVLPRLLSSSIVDIKIILFFDDTK